MKHYRCYLDTSVLNFALADNIQEKQYITLKYLYEIEYGGCDGFISELVLQEINRAPENKRDRLIEVINKIKLKSLEGGSLVDDLAGKYINAGLIPKKYEDDAIHIAIAVINQLDIVVSWNMEHMVKLKTRLGVNVINRLNGHREIEICTPEEVLGL